MYNLYIPLCGFVLSVILLILYRWKVTNIREENKIYFAMLIDLVVMIVFCMAAVYLIYIDYDQNMIKLANRIECVAICNYFMNLFMYVLYICGFKKKKYMLSYWIVNIVLGFAIFLTPISLELTNDLTYMVSTGLAVDITTIASGVALLSTFVLAIRNKRILGEKIIPIVLLLVFIIIVIVIRSLVPEFICLEFLATIATLIMYFTIENPDLKVISELNLSKEHAIKANQAKSDFLSSMSHEIRTPLNAIVGLSEDMARRDICPEEMKEDLNDVVSASRTLLEIVGNIMDINKIESDKMEIIEIPYNFKEEIMSLARVTGTRIGDKPIEYKINIAEDIPYELIGDRGHIKEVINNLLSNAIKYTEKGTIELNVQCINQDNKCLLIISVRDTGRGIKAEDITKLFTKFERLDVERNTTTEGTGLGLAITKKLVEMMGGTINVESNYGQGSLFVVQVYQKIGNTSKPLTDTQIIRIVEEQQIRYRGKKVLIVDDNKLNIKVARRALDSFEFEIDECENGQECLNKIQAGNFYDLILMDIMMHVMNGEEAIQKLKRIEGFNTPVIALTADALAGAKEKYVCLGFTDYIAKPFNRDQIKVKIDSIFIKEQKSYETK